MDTFPLKCSLPLYNIIDNIQEFLISKQNALSPINIENNDDISSSSLYQKYNSNVYIVSCIESESIYNSETNVELIFNHNI